MKKTFKFLLIIMFSIFVFLFTSCSNNDDTNNKTNENNSEIEEQTESEEVKQPLKLKDFNGFFISDLKKCPESANPHEFTLDEPNQSFSLGIYLNNKNKYPIESINISDVIYDKSHISYYKNTGILKISMNATNDYGIQVYKINSISYLMDDCLKELYIDNAYFILRLAPIHDVIASDFTYVSTPTTINFDVDIYDEDNITRNMELYYRVQEVENKVIISDFNKINTGNNTNILIDNLKEFTDYKLTIFYNHSFEDIGGTIINKEFAEFDFHTDRSLEINNIIADYESVTFNVLKEDEVNIQEMYLENTKLDKIEKIIYHESNQFTNIYSDTDYLLAVKFEYKGNEYIRKFPFKTKKYDAPTFEFSSYSAKYQTIDYEVVFNDPNNFATFDGVELYYLNCYVDRNDNLNGTFKNCIQNTNYVLKLTYSYNLHDGYEYCGKPVEVDIKTNQIDLSNISLILEQNGRNAIDYNLDCEKNSNDIHLDKIDLYLNNELYKSNEDGNLKGTFIDVYNDNKYRVKAYYSITLPGEESTYKGFLSNDITVDKLHIPVLDFKTIIGRDNIQYDITFDDVDKIGRLYDVTVYQGDKIISHSSQYEDTINGLLSGTTYNFRVHYFYNLNDHRTYNHDVIEEYKLTTDVYTKPTFDLTDVKVYVEAFSATVEMNDPTSCVVPGSLKVKISDTSHRKTYYPNDTHFVAQSGLCQASDHLLIFTYKYNLNDGEGNKDGYFEYSFHTLDQMVITEFTITERQDAEGYNIYDIYIKFKNPNYQCINGFIINGVEIEYDNEYRPEFIQCSIYNTFNFSNVRYGNTLNGLKNRNGEILAVTGKIKR